MKAIKKVEFYALDARMAFLCLELVLNATKTVKNVFRNDFY